MHHRETSQFTEESIAISNVSKPLTVATYARPGGGHVRRALVFVETNAIRFNRGGADAVATHARMPAGGVIELNGEADITRFRCIRDTADATIRVQYDE